MALLERDVQLAALTELTDAARSGEGAVVLVAGEAGAGKTSLATEWRRSFGDRADVLWGACDPLTTPRPLGPLYDFDSDVVPIGELLSAASEPGALFGELLDRFRQHRRPLVVVIEDAHWADDATLDLLRFVGRRIGDTGTIVLVTFRDDEVGPDHPLRVLVGQLSRLPTTHRLTVPPLTADALDELATGTRIDPAELHRLTGGNAFFATEVLAVGEGIPERVQDAVLARLGQLGSDARRAAQTVSVAPRSLELDLVARLARVTAKAIGEAVDAGVLVDTGGSLRFRHELARLAVEDSLGPSDRIGLHESLLGILADRPDPDLAQLAHHALGAGNPALVARYGPAAAEVASRAESHREAAALLELTVTHGAGLEPDQDAELRRRLAEELSMLDRHDDALVHAEAAAQHYRSVGDTPNLARALCELSSVYWRTQNAVAAEAALDEAIGILEAGGNPRELANAWHLRGFLAMLARRLGAARDAIDRSRRVVADADITDPALRHGQDLIAACNDIIGSRPREGLAALEEILERAVRAGDVRKQVSTLGMIGSGGAEARLYEPAIEALRECAELATTIDHDFSVAYARSWLARAAFEQGRWSEATELAELVDRTATHRHGIAMMTAMGALGRVRVRRGDPGGARVLQALLEDHGRYELQHVWSPICGLAEHLWLTGRGDEMVAVLSQTYERALAADSEWARGEVGFWMWRAGAIDSSPERSASPFRLHMDGDWAGAAAAWRELGCPYEEALALADGDVEAMESALGLLDELGARPAAGWLRARMRQRGVERIARGPNASTRENPAGLTRRQLEVTGLMIDGLSNAEIAERLFLSKKTVEHHVSAVFSKLGVTDRAKAIAAARSVLGDVVAPASEAP